MKGHLAKGVLQEFLLEFEEYTTSLSETHPAAFLCETMHETLPVPLDHQHVDAGLCSQHASLHLCGLCLPNFRHFMNP